MGKPMHETAQLGFAGAVDADGHILEPPDLWETYLEPEYRDRALRFILDSNGLEALEIGGKPSVMSRKGFPSTLGAMGAPNFRDIQLDPERTYVREAPFGSMDPDERSIAALADRFGDRFMWASDFPHADHTPEYVNDLAGLVKSLPDQHRPAFLGDNARKLYAIDA